MNLPSKRDDLLIIAVAISAVAVFFSIIGIGLGMRATDESKANVAAADARGRHDQAAGLAQTIELAAKNTAFDQTRLTASAGPVMIAYDNQDTGVAHNLHVTGPGVDDKTEIETGPATQRLELEVEPGTYTFVCDVHPQQMRGEIEVS